MTKNDKDVKKNKIRERRDRKPEILREATRLFGEYGFRGATLSTIAEAVGLSEPGLLHYFPSKSHLLMSVLEYRDQKDGEKYNATIANDSSNLVGSLEKLVADNEEVPELIQLFTVLVGESIEKEHPAHNFFTDRYDTLRKLISHHLVNYITVKGFAVEGDIDQLASLIIAVMDGLQIQWLLNPEDVSMTNSFNLFSKIITNYLKV
ncbi:MAG: TetR/AcrR family transcriptional regulator [Chloroflexi bacterium]|nr:TetR/AcrR family transcriptional regulator [Chloroflexota bacterium]